VIFPLNYSTNYVVFDGRVTSPCISVCAIHKATKSLFQPRINSTISHFTCRLMQICSFDGKWSVVFNKIKKHTKQSKTQRDTAEILHASETCAVLPRQSFRRRKCTSLEWLAFIQFSSDSLHTNINLFVLLASTKWLGAVVYTCRIAKMRTCQAIAIG
jgi:hypothetical protein